MGTVNMDYPLLDFSLADNLLYLGGYVDHLCSFISTNLYFLDHHAIIPSWMRLSTTTHDGHTRISEFQLSDCDSLPGGLRF